MKSILLTAYRRLSILKKGLLMLVYGAGCMLPIMSYTASTPTTALPFIPPSLTFAGESVPLDNPIVYDRLEKELTKNVYRQATTLTVLKRVQRYRQSMTRILERNKVPTDFFYLAVIESDLSPTAESPKKAAGFWQFMPSTADEYGLEMSKYVDERRHLTRSTLAASRFFINLYRSLKNWTLCAAAFNGGQGMVKNNLRAQGVRSFYDLYLTTETYDYVFRILALKLICENPERYGFSARVEEFSKPTQVVTVADDINLIEFARQHQMTYNDLKYYNPWLLYRSAWSQTDKYYNENKILNVMLEVPTGKSYEFLVTN